MSIRTVAKYFIGATLAGAIFSCQALAAATPLPEPLRTCAGIRNDTERLACYDAAVAHIESGTDTPAPSKENMFGATPASRAPAKKPVDETGESKEDLRQISARIVAVSQPERGTTLVALDNDQVWLQQDAEVFLTLENGDSVTITRASLGTFRLTDKRGRSARFKRVR